MTDKIVDEATALLWSQIVEAQPALAMLGPNANIRLRIAEKIAEGRAKGISDIGELCEFGRLSGSRTPTTR